MKFLSEIIIFITGWLLIFLLAGHLLQEPIIDCIEDAIEEAAWTVCKFPCNFPGPVYRLPVESAKYEYLKTIERKGGINENSKNR